MRRIFVLMVFLGITSAAFGDTPVKLTVNGQVLKAYLNDSGPARSLAGQLPVNMRLYDSDNDFCGGDLAIEYAPDDVQMRIKRISSIYHINLAV